MNPHPSPSSLCVARSAVERLRNLIAPPLCRALLIDDSGQDLVEYSLFGMLVMLATIASMRAVATGVHDLVQQMAAGVAQAFGM